MERRGSSRRWPQRLSDAWQRLLIAARVGSAIARARPRGPAFRPRASMPPRPGVSVPVWGQAARVPIRPSDRSIQHIADRAVSQNGRAPERTAAAMWAFRAEPLGLDVRRPLATDPRRALDAKTAFIFELRGGWAHGVSRASGHCHGERAGS